MKSSDGLLDIFVDFAARTLYSKWTPVWLNTKLQNLLQLDRGWQTSFGDQLKRIPLNKLNKPS